MLSGTVATAAVPGADTLLPKTTVGFVTASNFDNLSEQWKKTQLGKLMAEKVMEPFEQDFRQQLQKRWSSIAHQLGIKLEELNGVPGGEAALATIAPKPGEAATVLLIDVTGHVPQAQAVIDKARATLIKSGATETRYRVAGVPTMVFNVPPPKEEQTAPTRDGAKETPHSSRPARQTVYFIHNNVFGASDNFVVVQGIIARLTGNTAAGSLSEVVGYQQVMKRCADDAAGELPHVRWFIYPLGYAEAIRAATPPEQRRKGKTIVEIMRNQGFGAVQGVGGFLHVLPDGYQVLYRTAVHAPPPYVKSMKMLSLPNRTEFTPQPWVARDVAAYLTVYCDILNAFDNFNHFYDEMVGEPGVWAETLRAMKIDPHGPKIDLREELIKQLGQRVTVVTDFELPITPQSERLLFAIEVKDAEAVAKAIEKCVKNDPSAKKRVIDGQVIWEIVEEEPSKVPSLSVDVPSLAPRDEKPKKLEESEEPKEDDEKEGHFLPHGAMTVTKGNLLIASHIDFLMKVLKPIPEDKMLKNDPDFKKTWSIAETKLGMKEQCGRAFAWTDQEVQPTYELIRQGKMPESESLLGRSLNTFSGAAKKGTIRKQRIDGKKLPEFEVVQKAFGPGAACSMSEGNGWFVKGFLLTK